VVRRIQEGADREDVKRRGERRGREGKGGRRVKTGERRKGEGKETR